MRTTTLALAASMLFAGTVGLPTSSLAGLAGGNLSEAMPQQAGSAVQEVSQRRRGVRYERRMRQERRVRYERRAVRRCIRQGYCPIVYITVPVYFYVPIWYSAPIYYYY